MFTCTQTLLIVFILSFVNGQDRKITSENHPGCNECFEDDVLIYTRAEGPHDTIHQIWDFTGGVPTVILAVGSVNSTMDIHWFNHTPRYFNMSEKPQYSFAIAFDTLFQYNDTADNGYIDKLSPRMRVPLKDVTWRLAQLVQTDAEVMVQMSGALDYKDVRGTINVKLDLLPFQEYGVQLPHLIHTANSTLVDVALVDLTPSAGWNASRFALRATLVASEPADESMTCHVRKSLDDEHTPGVFEIIEIKTPASTKRGAGGFLQFRPVAYTRRARSVETSTVVRVSDFDRKSGVQSSTLRMYLRDVGERGALAESVLVSFGETGDGYYQKYNYTDWSLTVGYGSPPLEGFSAFVVGLICAGLGAPLALAAAGAAYGALRRRRHARLRDELDE